MSNAVPAKEAGNERSSGRGTNPGDFRPALQARDRDASGRRFSPLGGGLHHYVENGVTISLCIGLVGAMLALPLGLPAVVLAITGGLCVSLIDLPAPLRRKPGLFVTIGVLTTLVTFATGASAHSPWLLSALIVAVSALFAVLSALEPPWITLGVSAILALALGMGAPPADTGALLSHTGLFALGAAAYAVVALLLAVLIEALRGPQSEGAGEGAKAGRLDAARALSPTTLGFAVRLSLAMLFGYAITLLLPGYVHGGWVLLTIGLIMRANKAVTRQRRNARVLGTLAGCVIAAALARFTPFPVLVAAIILGAGLAHAYAPVNYAVTSLGASVMALLLLYLIQPAQVLVGDRILDTLIGAAISGLFSLAGHDEFPNERPAMAGGSAR